MDIAMWFRDRFLKLCQCIGANFVTAHRIFKTRQSRTSSCNPRVLSVCYPQNLAALALIGTGLCVIFLDYQSQIWRKALPADFLHTFGWMNSLGNSAWLLIASGVLCLVILSQDARDYGLRLKMAISSAFIYSAFLFYTVAASGLLIILIKWPLGRARPKLFDALGAFHFDPLIFKAAYSSFPSGHATTVGATVVALALIFPTWRWFIAACGFWVALSRVIWGAHYPSDAFTGVLLGATFSYYSAHVMARRRIGFRLSQDGRIHRLLGVSSAHQCWHALRNAVKKRKPDQTKHSASAKNFVTQQPEPLQSGNYNAR